jgi:hypothetical protein
VQPDRPVQTTLAFHASRIVIDVGVLLAMAAMSMPFVSVPGGDRSALTADALPAVLLLLPIFIVTLIPDHTRPLHPVLGWASMVLALAALPYAFVKMLDARVLADTLGGSMGPGPTVLLAGCVVTLVGIGIGIVRDLFGKPSGGTPQRNSAYETKRSRERTQRSGAPNRASSAGAKAAAGNASTADEGPTRIVAGTAVPEPADAAAPAEQPAGAAGPDPMSAQPEIVFPDTGAVAREAEPEDSASDDLMDTAERADVAMTESLLSMFPDDADDEGADED